MLRHRKKRPGVDFFFKAISAGLTYLIRNPVTVTEGSKYGNMTSAVALFPDEDGHLTPANLHKFSTDKKELKKVTLRLKQKGGI